MPEFFNVLPPDDAIRTLHQHLSAVLPESRLATESALNRTTTSDIIAPFDLPAFPRSTMDGYAVRAKDTFGASQTMPAYLKVVGEVPMGNPATVELQPGQTAIVHTGGMIPSTANAVVMVENTQAIHQNEIEVLNAVAVGENVLKVGEDVRHNDVIIPAGHTLRPQDIGALMALGLTYVTVTKPPTIGIIATGDEVKHPSSEIHPGQIRDINSYTVSALVERAGGVPLRYGIVADNIDALNAAAQKALLECDAVVISAGSSVSVRDLTADVAGKLGSPGVLAHGVAIKPGKPTILAVAQGKPIIGLPGNPVSALVTADIFLVPTIYRMQGITPPDSRILTARITHNIASTAGREDYIPGRFSPAPPAPTQATEQHSAERWVQPVFGKSNLIFTLVHADGAIMVPLNANGLAQGQLVDVKLF